MNTFDAAATYWRYHSYKISGGLESGLYHLSNRLDRIVQSAIRSQVIMDQTVIGSIW